MGSVWQMEAAAHQQWPLRRAWLLQEPPRSFLGSGELPCVSATSPSPVRVGTPAWSLEAGLWGPPSGRPRQGRPEGARAWPGTRRPAAEAKCEACSAACWPSSERPPLWLPERSRGLGQSRCAKREPPPGQQVSPSGESQQMRLWPRRLPEHRSPAGESQSLTTQNRALGLAWAHGVLQRRPPVLELGKRRRSSSEGRLEFGPQDGPLLRCHWASHYRSGLRL